MATAVAGATFLDPHVLARIGSLELIARGVVDGFINGLHHAPYLGLSMDFAEHRAYMPGDDIRRIDWRLYARSDRYHVKQFEADTNTNFSVLLDVSRSMDFGSGAGLTKFDYARYLAACLAYFCHKQRDRVGLVTFDGGVVDHVPPSAKHLEEILYTLDRSRPRGAGGMLEPFRRVSEHFRRRSILAVVSDFYEEPDAVLEALGWLIQRGNEVIVFQVLDPAELDFPFKEAINFEDVESGELMPVIPEQARAEYQRLIQEHTSELSRRMTERRIDYMLLNTATPLDYALFYFLSRRETRARVR